MRRVRPGAAASRGGAGGSPSRTTGAERALTSVATGDRHDQEREAGQPRGPERTAEDVREGREPVRTAHETGPACDGRAQPADLPRLWHITLRVSGARTPVQEVRRGLEQLAHDHPFLLTSRYADDHAEVRYWEEARDLHDAAAVALRLWGEHRRTAQLPPWEIVGLEVVDRDAYHQRLAEGYGPPPATPVGVHPF
ncbi:hypothetical protein [Streptomyces sp. NPDC093260]|uniref:hypothetical protein n=1 Tax=Streptomyces sp. NPDC093260 TaxID=3155073 RepID=UPI00342E282E